MRRISLLALLLFSTTAQAQKAIYFVPHVGISWQSTLIRSVSPEPNNSTVHALRTFPYNSEKGTQGFGLDAGGTIAVNATN